MPKSYYFLSLHFQLSNRNEVMAAIAQATREKPVRIATLNPEFMLEVGRNSQFATALSQMTHCLIDGSGLFFCLTVWQRLRGQPEPIDLYPGADLVNDLFKKYKQGEKRFFLLGGEPGISQQAQQHIQKLYPGCQIVGAESGGRIDAQHITLDPDLLKQLTQVQPDILLVGFGAPKQELWIQAASEKLNIPVMIGVGGTFGFYSHKQRAPLWLRRLHLEWLYRGITEPGHWRRLWQAVMLFPIQAFLWMGKRLALNGKDSK